MQHLLRRLFTLGAFFAAALCAQDISGTWRGDLSPPNMNRDLRIVMKASNGDGAAWKATMDGIDQGPQLELKLAATKAPVGVLVIDRAEKPAEN